MIANPLHVRYCCVRVAETGMKVLGALEYRTSDPANDSVLERYFNRMDEFLEVIRACE